MPHPKGFDMSAVTAARQHGKKRNIPAAARPSQSQRSKHMEYPVVTWDDMRVLASGLSVKIETWWPETGRADPLKSTIRWLEDCALGRPPPFKCMQFFLERKDDTTTGILAFSTVSGRTSSRGGSFVLIHRIVVPQSHSPIEL